MTATYLEAARAVADGLASELLQDVQACESVMAQRLNSDVGTVHAIGEHVAESGGKRLRPALVSLCARACLPEASRERIAAVGACVEMVHMATLIHDDVIDHAPTRRGRPTASAVWGSTAAILSGDVLLAKAMDILAEDGDLRIIRAVSKAVVELAEGEVAELEARGDFDLTVDRHLEIIRKKTASFMRCCCEIGALIADAPNALSQSLAEFGECMGMGFQIADDLLDYNPSDETGKPQAGDFKEGQATLPMIYLRDRLNSEEDAFVRSKFGNGSTPSDIDKVFGLLDARGASSLAFDDASQYAVRACEQLEALEPSPAKELLLMMPQMLVKRRA